MPTRWTTSQPTTCLPWPRPRMRWSRALNAGVWVFGGGLENQKARIVGTDGTVTDGPYPEAIGGFCVVDVPSREDALAWAAKIARACRCAQEVREFMPDPAVGN